MFFGNNKTSRKENERFNLNDIFKDNKNIEFHAFLMSRCHPAKRNGLNELWSY